MELVDLHFHIGRNSWKDSRIELTASNGKKSRRLLFHGVSNLRIEEGFSGSLAGMIVADISDRQWDSARIEIQNFEQDPGITFLALSMEIIDDT